MPETIEQGGSLSVWAALCVAPDALDRFSRVLRHLVVGLIDQAVQLRLLSSDERVASLALGPVQPILHAPIRGPFARRRISAVVDELSPQPPNVVHALSGASYRLGAAVAEAFDAPLVVQVTSFADCDLLGALDPLLVNQCLAFSEPLLREVESRSLLPAVPVELVRPGLLAFQGVTAFEDPGRLPTVLCAAPLEEQGGVDRLVEALAMLRQRGRILLAFLLGEGSREALLRKLVRRLGLTSCVTFAHPAGDIAAAMHGADLFVQPTTDDAFSADSLLAMSAGMAVVAFPASACDHLHDGRTALVCRSPSAEALADAIEQLVADPAAARRIASDGLEYVRTHHAVSPMAECIAAVYRKLALSRATFALRR